MPDSHDLKKRAIRSFVRREGRLTPAQERALTELWPQWGVDYRAEPLDFTQLFERAADTVLEIGFGNGTSLLEMAAAAPQCNFFGIEVHRPGAGRLLAGIEREALANVRVSCHDAVEVLQHQVAPGSLSKVLIFFPDPWHKKRHNKRRLVQAPFLDLLAARMKTGGILHMATDWEPYAEQMLDIATAHCAFANVVAGITLADGCVERPPERPLTRFEQRGQRRGHGVWDLKFQRLERG